jgi:anti-sigma regulatory factor (Ser/Thr protein kinase)
MESVIESSTTTFCASIRVDVDEQTQIGGARRAAVALAQAQRLASDTIGRLAIIATEAATNIVRHAGRGYVVMRGFTNQDGAGVELLALDKGPGIPDVTRAMRAGYSTIGTAGQGLGGIARLADVFDIHSQRGMGTAVLARVGDRASRATRKASAMSAADDVGVVCVPLHGEIECGDAWQVNIDRNRIMVLVVDGLGHGPEAATAATAAMTTFSKSAAATPEAMLVAFGAALRDTRGAAASIVAIHRARRQMQFSGVGNVDGRVLSNGATQHLIPQNGIVGHGMPTPRATDATWPPGSRLVMHSDGIIPRWRLDAYETGAASHPALLAGLIYRDFARDRDDATVLVLRDAVGAVAEEHR